MPNIGYLCFVCCCTRCFLSLLNIILKYLDFIGFYCACNVFVIYGFKEMKMRYLTTTLYFKLYQVSLIFCNSCDHTNNSLLGINESVNKKTCVKLDNSLFFSVQINIISVFCQVSSVKWLLSDNCQFCESKVLEPYMFICLLTIYLWHMTAPWNKEGIKLQLVYWF